MAWIDPLTLETWFINVFAGDADYFIAVALLVISSMAAYMRMTTLTMFFMIGIFILMLSGIIQSPLLYLFAVVGGLLIGWQISKLVTK